MPGSAQLRDALGRWRALSERSTKLLAGASGRSEPTLAIGSGSEHAQRRPHPLVRARRPHGEGHMGAARNVARTSIEGKRRKRTGADNALAPLAEELNEVSCAVENAGHLAAVLENHLFY